MDRYKIIEKIGKKYKEYNGENNIENGEFSYVQALKKVGKNIKDLQRSKIESNHQYLD